MRPLRFGNHRRRPGSVLLIGCGRIAPAAVTQFYDTFSELNVAITSHTPNIDLSGLGWADATGTPRCIANNFGGVSSGENSARFNMSVASYTLTVDVTWSGGESFIILFRFDNATYLTGWNLQYLVGSLEWRLYDPAGALVASYGATLSNGATYAISIVVSGNNVDVSIDGTLRLSGSSATNNTKVVGYLFLLGPGAAPFTTFDNLLVVA